MPSVQDEFLRSDTMREHKRPIACQHHPLCEPLRQLFLDYSLNHPDMGEIVFFNDTDPVCSHCEVFEAKKELPRGNKKLRPHFSYWTFRNCKIVGDFQS